MSKNDVYRSLAERHGYKDSLRYRRILEYLMTPKQAELAALMPMKYEELAKKLNMDVAAVKKEVEGLYRKGVVFARGRRTLRKPASPWLWCNYMT